MCLFLRATTKKKEALNVTSSTSDKVGQSKTKKSSLPYNYKEATSDDTIASAQESSTFIEDSTVSEWN